MLHYKGTPMNPADLSLFLNGLIQNRLKLSTMIWGPPGIGKSSIVAQVAAAYNLECIDLRLSQLAPTDLRGLPVAVPPEASIWHEAEHALAADYGVDAGKRPTDEIMPPPAWTTK